MNNTLKLLTTKAERITHTTLDTVLVTPESVKEWSNPPFQRPLKVNDKVRALATQIRADGGVIPGVITLGVLDDKTYKLDGQHRLEAFLLSECHEGFADVRRHLFSSMAGMGEEFVNLNSHLVNMKPDDILRGLEGTLGTLAHIRKRCPFVGYDMVRRGDRSPIVGMSAVLRAWTGGTAEVPTSTGPSTAQRATAMTEEESTLCAEFLTLCHKAWGRDAEFHRLWGGLNLTLCAWLYRRLVIMQYSPKSPRLNKEQFTRCLMALSADSGYLEWLVSRVLNERNRSPGYLRIKNLFSARLAEDFGGKRPPLPQPAWVSSHNR